MTGPKRIFAAGWSLAFGACLLGACHERPGNSARQARTGASGAAARADGPPASSHGSGTAKLSPAVRARWTELVGRQLPVTFADAEEERFYARCLEFTRALHDKAADLEQQPQRQSRDPTEPPALLRAVKAVQLSPPKMPSRDVAWCAAYTVKSLRAELGATVARQAEATLQAMAGAMVVAHERTGKLCPSTVEPVPPKLELVTTGPFEPDGKSWDGPAWRCLRFRWLRPLRFQYELKSETDRFEFIARGSPAANGRIDEYRLAGRIQGGGIVLGAATGRFLTEQQPEHPGR